MSALVRYSTMRLDHWHAVVAFATPMTLLCFAADVGAAERRVSAAEAADSQLVEVVVTGTRFNSRTVLSSPVPIDVVSAEDLRAAGRTELGEALSATVPAFNFSPAMPASSLSAMRAFTYRALPPQDVLVLVNGKRWHPSMVVGLSTVTFDFNSIPPGAVGTVEVLRDGAAAQYGSDAIAGVVNVRLRKDTNTELTASSGQYYAGDGLTIEAGLDTGVPIGDEGFLRASAYYRDVDETNRQGRDVRQQYFALDPGGRPVILATTSPSDATPVLPPGFSFDPREFTGVDRLDNYVIGNNSRREAGLNFNSELPFSDSMNAYAFGGYTHRSVDTLFLNRRPLDNNNVRAIYPNGYTPVYEARITDAQVVAGLKGRAYDWDWDVSQGWGVSRIANYGDTINVSMGAASPTHIYSGEQRSEQATTNLDLKRGFDVGLSAPLNMAVGSEFRHERLKIKAGEPAAYINGGVPILDGPNAGGVAAIGAQGVGGFTPSDAVGASRHSIAAYVDLENQLTEDLLVTLAGRYEHYSDFGSTVNGKLSFLEQVNKIFGLRGSVSTGFRAPALYETYFSTTGSQVIGGQFLVNRTFPVGNPVAQALGAKELDPEKSVNYSAGVTFAFSNQLMFTADVYRIYVRDAIIQSSTFSGAGLTNFLAAMGFAGINSASFMTNAVDKRVDGLDLEAQYTMPIGEGSLALSLGANFNDPRVQSVAPTPAQLAALSSTPLFSRQRIVAVERGAPRSRINASITYARGGFQVLLRETRYGSTEEWGGNNAGSLAQVFGTKWVTDLDLSYDVTAGLRVTAGAQNLFDEYPDENNALNNPAGFLLYPFNQGNAPFGISGGYYYVRAVMRF
jgi:iron complex outermembrane recepter protein